MPKDLGSEADFINSLRSRTERSEPAVAEGGDQRMKLRRFVAAPKLSMEEMLAAHSQADAAGSHQVHDAGTPPRDQSFSPAIDALSTDDRARGEFVAMTALRTHPWNARVHRTLSRIQEIASQIATGQNAPVLVTPNAAEPGSYYVVDGETRFQAAKVLGWSEIWVREIAVDPTDPLAFYLESLRQTSATEAISPIDQGIRFQALIDSGAATIDSLAAGRGIHRSGISRMLSYSRFPEQVLAYMHQHADRFSYSVAAALAPLAERLRDEDALLAYCHQVVDSESSRRDIEAYVKGEVAPKKTRQPRRSAMIAKSIKTPQGVIGLFRTFESGALEFKLNPAHGLSEEALSKLIDILSEASDSLSQGTAGSSRSGSRKAKGAEPTSN